MIERLNAALEGRYRVERELGAGGMATVYLAEDLRHRRKVALKVLKPELAAVVGGERFLTEIQTTANLQHPHILPLFDSGEADSFLFYVMPYVEGESLRERLEKEHQLPVDEAIEIATSVGSALQHAHEQGVVHRDIKPANILLSGGQPLVADFGIALALSQAGDGRITETGLSLGTPHYMSPEQAAGDRTLDKRSDVYALGCVLYEMLAGQPPFPAKTAQAVLAQILTGEPTPPSRHRKSIPTHVEHVILKALEKLPADRFENAESFTRALRTPSFRSEAGSAVGETGDGGSRRRGLVTAGVAAVALAVGGTAGWMARDGGAPSLDVVRYAMELPAGQGLAGSEIRPRLALSADGSRLIYVGESADGGTQLWIRERDRLDGSPIPGTEGAHAPFLSPDGSRVGFVVALPSGEQGLVLASLGGRPPVLLVDSLVGQDGASWGDDDAIYYDGITAGGTRGIMRVAAGGGAPEQVTTVDTAVGETDHVWPSKLPGEDAIVYTVVRAGMRDADIAIERLDGSDRRLLVRGVAARYVDSGHLVWATIDGEVMSAPFDLGALDLAGPAVERLRGINVRLNGSVDLAVSSTGRLAYYTGAPGIERFDPVVVDLNGNGVKLDQQWPSADIASLALSPDGRRLAVSIVEGDGEQIWVKELPRGPLTRLTAGMVVNRRPVWTDEGRAIAYIADPAPGRSHGRKMRADGGATFDTLLIRPGPVQEVIPTGDLILFREGVAGMQDGDFGYVPADDPDGAGTVFRSEFNERGLALSPDRTLLAYVSDASGRDEVFVRPFPEARVRRLQVSTAGGTEPVWSRSGDRLFFRDGDDWLNAATIAADPSLRVERRERLFDASPYRSNPEWRSYDVIADDQQLLMLRSTGFGRTESGSLVIVENWFAELER